MNLTPEQQAIFDLLRYFLPQCVDCGAIATFELNGHVKGKGLIKRLYCAKDAPGRGILIPITVPQLLVSSMALLPQEAIHKLTVSNVEHLERCPGCKHMHPRVAFIGKGNVRRTHCRQCRALKKDKANENQS